MELQFRDAVIDNLPHIVEIYNSIVPGRMVTADTEPVTVESRMKWFNDHEPVHRPLWMVTDEGKEIGWVSFQSFYGRPAYNATAEISIYLDEKARGKGYGEKILNHAMNSCERLGIETLLGFIFAHNGPSRKLFGRAGFEEWAHLPRVAKLDDVERDLIIVGKRIKTK
jgi:phosphinothricin acetyltransferase